MADHEREMAEADAVRAGRAIDLARDDAVRSALLDPTLAIRWAVT